MLDRRLRFPAAVAVLGAILFVIAAILGQHPHGTFKNVLGGIGWFGFLICVLALILWALYFGVQSFRHRTARQV
jgi:drug/metabolite transporter (DMT)-like permease